MKFSRKTQKKQESKASLSLQKIVMTNAKYWSKRTLSEISEFSILGVEQNQKFRKLWNFIFFLLKTYIDL